MIQIKFAQKIERLSNTLKKWQLKLDPLISPTARKQKILTVPQDEVEVYWNSLAQTFLTLNEISGDKKIMVGLETLYGNLLSLANPEKALGVVETKALIMSLLFWESLKASPLDSLDEFDNQAIALHSLYELFLKLELQPDSFLQAALGRLFQIDFEPKKPVGCYFYNNGQKTIDCLPQITSLPPLNVVFEVLDGLYRQPEQSDYQQQETREHLAKFRILCERQRIRKLRSRLMNL